ncbi:MAG: hypothetical protein J6L00_03005, partial [Clostridia bacterium]|nr:hypothetical protein [Clostridia bacterium]
YIVNVYVSTPKTGAEDEKYQYYAYSAYFPISKSVAEEIFPSLCEKAENDRKDYIVYTVE